nr:hypothetical protein [Aeropyrum camini]
MSLLRYAVTRALAIVPTVLILYTVVFIVLRVIPGDLFQPLSGLVVFRLRSLRLSGRGWD